MYYWAMSAVITHSLSYYMMKMIIMYILIRTKLKNIIY